MMTAVKCIEAVFGYGDEFSVGPFDLIAQSGDKILLTGSNGSGKSTILRSIVGLQSVVGGKIVLDEIGNQGSDIGWISDARSDLPEELTANEIWEITARMNDRGKVDKLMKKAGRLAELFNFQQTDLPLRAISHGSFKKCAIVTALMTNRRLLVLDEPTDGVDQKSSKSIIAYLNMMKKEDSVLFVASHDTRFLEIATTHIDLSEYAKGGNANPP